MFYINPNKKVDPIKEKQVLSAVLIPPEERVTKDHQTLFSMLKELERTKSLNARIKCIAGLLLITKQLFISEEHILMHMFQDQRLIVLPVSIKTEAQAFNEKLIRRKMDLLCTFSITRTLTYSQLLYLAFNMEEQQCKYKDYLYRQGDEVEHFYLIVEGEFHYVKDCNQNQSRVLLNKKKSKLARIKVLQGEEQNPNKYVKPHIIRYKVGIVEGKLGQSIGLQQIVLEQYKEKGRKYSVFCNSTQNKYIKIHRRFLQALMQELPSFHQVIHSQVQEANTAKDQLFEQIKATKVNLNKYLKKSVERGKQQSSQGQQMKTLQNAPSVSASRNNLPLISKKSSYISEDRSRVFSSALSGPTLKSEENHLKSMKSESNLQTQGHPQRYQQQTQGSFNITSIRESSNRKSLKSPKDEQQASKQLNEIRQSFQSKDFNPDIYLPLIGKRSISNIGEMSNVDEYRSKERSRMRQYGGMVDSSKLIKEKESILQRKSNKLMREDIFPIGHVEYKQTNKTNREDPMKLKASPAHSNRFMEKMLLKVLKKAGYDESVKQKEDSVSQNKAVHIKAQRQFHGSLSRHKKKQQNKIIKKEDLLVSSPFDDCYFAKI